MASADPLSTADATEAVFGQSSGMQELQRSHPLRTVLRRVKKVPTGVLRYVYASEEGESLLGATSVDAIVTALSEQLDEACR